MKKEDLIELKKKILELSNEEKEKYITEFISDLINNQILLQD